MKESRSWFVMFDGKIGIWAFVEETAAKNNSKNRLKGKQLTALSLNLIICSRKRKTTHHAAVGDLYDRSFAVDVPDAS
jgi:mannose-1-phosphate guanylyltransferase